MIHFVVTREHRYTIRTFLEDWGAEMRPEVRVVPYEGLRRWRRQAPGTWIFTDLDRLDPAATDRAVWLWDKLVRAGPQYRLLNHPQRWMRRYDLLRALHGRGINPHRVYRLDEDLAEARFPVFVRDQGHGGALTGLLHTPDELDRAVRVLDTRRGKLVVEFTSVADERGTFRKYAAFRIGDRIVARHVFFGREWMVKEASLVAGAVEEELDYVRANPHAGRLMEIFELAGIEYGRIDYGVLGDRLVVWEINTNPMIASRIASRIPERREVNRIAIRGIIDALRETVPA